MPVCSPRVDFSSPGSMLSSAPQLSLSWSRPLVTAFPSPATAAPSQEPPFQGQRSWPATSRPTGWLLRPVRLRLHRSPWFAPRKVASSLQARCVSACRLDWLLPRSPLPSGTFASLGIKAFNRFRRHSARLPNPPDSLSLPAAGSISRVGYGSPFLGRYVSGGLLFLKPLGTSFTMRLDRFSVNSILDTHVRFPQYLAYLFS